MTTPEERIRAAMAEAANKAAEIFASDHAVAAAGLQAGLCALYRELASPGPAPTRNIKRRFLEGPRRLSRRAEE
jgi:hypothetical protein